MWKAVTGCRQPPEVRESYLANGQQTKHVTYVICHNDAIHIACELQSGYISFLLQAFSISLFRIWQNSAIPLYARKPLCYIPCVLVPSLAIFWSCFFSCPVECLCQLNVPEMSSFFFSYFSENDEYITCWSRMAKSSHEVQSRTFFLLLQRKMVRKLG